MEIYIRFEAATGKITFIHRAPFNPTTGLNKSREELLKTGVFVAQFPDPVNCISKRAVPYYNTDTHEVYYKYESVELSDKERLDLLENAMNTVLLGGLN